MENPQVQAYNPSLEKVLKSYQTVAMSSLGGPSSYRPSWPESAKQLVETGIMKEAVVRVSASNLKSSAAVSEALEHHRSIASGVKMEYDALLHPPPFPIQQMPVFTPIDQTKSEKGITVLEDEAISCFTVGGEKRLCLPQILNSVLRDFSLQQINAVCDDLHIYCSRCSPEQLEILKVTGILPYSAPSCGLITKTDAERLCNALLHGIVDTRSPKSLGAPSTADEKPKHPTENSMKVYHECFGKCKGLLTPELYETANSSCIECLECGVLLSPQKFIVHGHRRRETRTCHWGFDSDNWRNYLLLARDQNPEEKYTEALDAVKAKFDPTCKYKRKQQGLDENGNAKRLKGETPDEEELCKDAIITSSSWPGSAPFQRPSAFRPWSPSILNKEGKVGVLPDHGTVLVRDSRGMPTYLSMGPPVLQNPERVIPHTAASKFDSQFAPNVALAPPLKLSPSSKESLSPDGEKDRDTKADLDVSVDGTMEQDIELVKTMLLETNAMDSRVGREKLLHELARIRIRQEEKLQAALAAKRKVQQEMEFEKLTKKDKIKEAMDGKRSLRKELDRLRIEYERTMRESNESRQRLKRELELARSRRNEKTNEMGRDNSRLTSQNEYLRDRVRELEEERDQLQRELESYRKKEAKGKGDAEKGKEDGEKVQKKEESKVERRGESEKESTSDTNTEIKVKEESSTAGEDAPRKDEVSRSLPTVKVEEEEKEKSQHDKK